MSVNRVYAIGDLQGCLDPLKRLLDHIQYEPAHDQLWFAGDLVNRGPHSLETLRFVKSLSEQHPGRIVSVLGNHDLHLLALASGATGANHPTLNPILTAVDREELIHWLQHQPLIHRDRALHAVLVHAGIYPAWRIKEAATYAREVEIVLQSERASKLLKKMYGRRPAKWRSSLAKWDRYRFIINACTRMRFIHPNGKLDFANSVPPGKQRPRRLIPWYQASPAKPRKNWRIVFGHWSAAGAWFDGNHIALDSGCVWGKKLTAARLDQRRIRLASVDCE